MPYKDSKKSLEAVKRHYESNKDEVLKKRIINRILDGKVPQMASLEKFEITEDMVNEMRKEVGLEPIKIKPTGKKRPKKEPVALTLQSVHDHYNKLAEDKKIAPRTGETHYSNFVRIIKGLGCEDSILDCLKDHEKVIKYIQELKTQKKTDATINTKQSYITAVLNVIDTMKIKVPREQYSETFDKMKKEKESSNTQKQLTEEVEKFSTIKKRIEDNNPDWSQEVVMINLYDEVTPRNDFQNLTFDTSDPNHIDLDEGTITLREFKKTDKKYEPIVDYKLSESFMKLLKNSLKEQPRDKVFTKKMESIFKKAKTGINQIRHSKISEELSGENLKDPAKREELRSKMLHSSATQLNYIRNLKD